MRTRSTRSNYATGRCPDCKEREIGLKPKVCTVVVILMMFHYRIGVKTGDEE
jgi:hypothetical protein